MSEQNNIYVDGFSDEEMDDFASAINSVIETFCKFSDKHNFDRDNIIGVVAEKLYQFSEIATVKHYKVNDQTTIDPVLHGKWIMRGGKLFCSECGKKACVARDSDDFWYTKGTCFCPNCVAKMDKEDGKNG